MHRDRADHAGRSASAEGATRRRQARRRWSTLSAVVAVVLGCGLAGTGTDAVAAVLVGLVAGVLTWCIGRVLRRRGDPGRWERGSAGESATAGILAALPARRWVVLHDRAVPVPGSRANLDHVVIGPTGVWVVDSKAYRAPLRAHWRSVYAGSTPLDTAPAAWEAEVLDAALGGPGVRAVVAVHGTGLGRRGRRVGGVPVIPATALVARLRRRRLLRGGPAPLRRRDVVALAARCDELCPPAGRPVRGRLVSGAGGRRA